ncbi:MAG: hypothetical protein QXU40_02460 [Candidatus Pacearchaeota archaeon]
MQLGKRGVTDNFILTLKNHFKRHKNVKVCVLKSGGHKKERVKECEDEILRKLGKGYTTKRIGFTIFIKKWRKEIG